MGRAPCCDKANVKKGPWSPEEDAKLKQYIQTHGTAGNWIALPQKAGLRRCGKSCRLRWLNYLRPNIKHGDFTDEEDRIICTLFTTIGSRWSIIATHLPSRTDNDIKNYWNTKLKKKLIMGTVPIPPVKPNSAAASSFFQASPSSSSSSPPPFHGGDYQQVPAYSFPSSSSSVNQLSYGGEMEYDYGGGGRIDGGGQMVHFQNYFHGGVYDQKPIFSGGGMIGEDGWIEKQNCVWEETPLDYSLEEIKRLISSSSYSNNHLSFEECKTEEKVLYF